MKRIISSAPDNLSQYLRNIWQHRSLIWVFARRDLKVKYAQTALGLGWTIVQPLTALAIFTYFFGYVLELKAGRLPYSLYVLSGLLGWNFFSYIVFQGIGSIQESGHLIRKIYFPKGVLPLSKALVAGVELGITFLLLIPLLLWHGQEVSWRIILIPGLLIFNALVALFLVFLTASVSYRMRDLHHVIPFLVYFGIWLTPVFFTADILPAGLKLIWLFNPMAAVVEGWRWCLFPNWGYDYRLLPVLLSIIPAFLLSLMFYKRAETKFSDFV